MAPNMFKVSRHINIQITTEGHFLKLEHSALKNFEPIL